MNFKNLALGYVATAPSPATTGTSLVLGSGEGARFPQPSTDGNFYVTAMPPGENPNVSNSEILQVTARSTNTLTIVREQGDTTAKTIEAGWIILQSIYKENILDDDTMATASATTLATSESTKAYVDTYGQNASMARQAVINGNFDIWQRGTSVALTDDTQIFEADRWADYVNKDGGTLPTLTRSRELLTSGDIANAFYYSKLTTNGAGSSLGVNSQGAYYQRIEKGTKYLCGNGKKVTVSFWAKSDIAGKRISPTLLQTYGTGGSPSSTEIIKGTPITLTSTWTRYTHTFTTNTLVGKTFGTDDNDCLQVLIYYMWGTTFGNSYVETSVTAETFGGAGYIGIAQIQLCAGDVALPFQPKSTGDEYQLCRRYYRLGSLLGVANTTAWLSISLDLGSMPTRVALTTSNFKIYATKTAAIAEEAQEKLTKPGVGDTNITKKTLYSESNAGAIAVEMTDAVLTADKGYSGYYVINQEL